MAGPGPFLLVDDEVEVGDAAGNNNSPLVRAVSVLGYGPVYFILDVAHQSPPLQLASFRIHREQPARKLPVARVVSTEGPFVLIHVQFGTQNRFRSIGEQGHELFMYHNTQPPAVLAIKAPQVDVKLIKCFAIIPRGGGDQGGGFLLAAIAGRENMVDSPTLIIFSSVDHSWATHALPSLPWADGSFCSYNFIPDKAIAMGQNQALFADLDGGVILSADLSSDPPILKYFVDPSGGFDARIERLVSPNFCNRFCRDVSFTKGLITFAQIENRMAISSLPQNAMELRALKDSDLIPSWNRKRSCPEPDLVCNITGRSLVLWSRTTSGEAWSNYLIVNLDEIELAGLTSQKAHLHLPAIAVDGNTVYMRAVGNFGDEEGQLISVDLHTRSLTTLAAFPTLPMERLVRPRFISEEPQ